MYISRVEVPWDAARNPYDFHRQLWRLFPDEARESRQSDTEARQGFLFRVEEHRPGRTARLLVQSRRPPAVASGLVLIGAREFNPRAEAGQRLAFVVTANPIKTIVDAQRDAKAGKKSVTCRVPLIREEEQRAWLERKLAGAAAVEAATVLTHPPLHFRKGNRGGKLVTVTFEGVLQVLDPVLLLGLQENGIGPAKGFGCGLLLVRRLG